MSEYTHCQVLGPFNTGTVLMQCYVNQLFRNTRHGGFPYWKHSVPPRYQRNADGAFEVHDGDSDFPGVLFVCMVRSPYYWLPATSRRPYNIRFHARSFDMGRRLRSAVHLKGDFFINLVQVWNQYYLRYARHLEPQGHVIYVRLEDLVRNPRATIRILETRLQRRPGSDVQATIDSMADAPRKSDNAFGTVWEEKNRLEFVTRALRREDLSFINQQIDPLLMQKFAYSYAWPAPRCA